MQRGLFAGHGLAAGGMDALRRRCTLGRGPGDGWALQAAMRIGHDEAVYALGPVPGDTEAGPAAHGLRDEMRAFDAEGVHQATEVIGEASPVFRASGVLRKGEAAMVESDAGVAVAEVGHLLPPGEVVAAGAVGEDDDGRAAEGRAVDFVVEVDAVDGCEGHGRAPRSGMGRIVRRARPPGGEPGDKVGAASIASFAGAASRDRRSRVQ